MARSSYLYVTSHWYAQAARTWWTTFHQNLLLFLKKKNYVFRNPTNHYFSHNDSHKNHKSCFTPVRNSVALWSPFSRSTIKIISLDEVKSKLQNSDRTWFTQKIAWPKKKIYTDLRHQVCNKLTMTVLPGWLPRWCGFFCYQLNYYFSEYEISTRTARRDPKRAPRVWLWKWKRELRIQRWHPYIHRCAAPASLPRG